MVFLNGPQIFQFFFHQNLIRDKCFNRVLTFKYKKKWGKNEILQLDEIPIRVSKVVILSKNIH